MIQKIHHLNEDQLKVIYVGVDLQNLELSKSREELRRELKVPEDIFVILSVGRHVPRKNFQLVIKAVNQIKKKNPDVKIHYYLIGAGEETENLKRITKELKLENEIRFLGICDIQPFYNLSLRPTVFSFPFCTTILLLWYDIRKISL